MTAPANLPSFDLAQYMGRWYEIARTDNPFEAQCVSDVTADYALSDRPRSDGQRTVTITNRCMAADGTWWQETGTAVPTQQPGRLLVSFQPNGARGPTSEYRILDVGDVFPGGGYQSAIVGSGTGTNLWLLARTPRIDQRTLGAMLARAAQFGFSAASIRPTVHVPR